MFKYILKRLVYVVFVFFIVSIIMFGVYKSVPGDPARIMIDSSKSTVNPEAYEQMYQAARVKLGLDKPVVVQYFSWIKNMITGDFGFSLQYKQPVRDIVGTPMINTIKLNLISLVFVFAITIPLGIVTAVKKNSVLDKAVQVGSIVGYSLPSFVISLLSIFLFAIILKWFPISGSGTPGSTLTGWAQFGDQLKYLALPVIVMTISSLGGITRYVRAAMIDALSTDYIRTARAKGLKEKTVIYSHAFRNALIPIVTILTSWFVGIFGGSVVIETIFLWNGIGKYLFDALMQRDFSVVLAMQMFYVVITLAGNLIMDIAYSLVDPRVKLEN